MQKSTQKITKNNLKIGERVQVIRRQASYNRGPVLETDRVAIVGSINVPKVMTRNGRDGVFACLDFFPANSESHERFGRSMNRAGVDYADIVRATVKPDYQFVYTEYKVNVDTEEKPVETVYRVDCHNMRGEPVELSFHNRYFGQKANEHMQHREEFVSHKEFSFKDSAVAFMHSMAAFHNGVIVNHPGTEPLNGTY